MEPRDPVAAEPVDPDVDLRTPAGRAESRRQQAPVLAVVAAGGAAGACARYGAGLLWPSHAGSFPWTTLLVNVAGCAVIGVFMVVVTELRTVHRLVRPFFGTGVLGGFTTFSTYTNDVRRLSGDGRPGVALAYLALTLAACLAAVWAAASATRAIDGRRRR